MKPDEWAKKHGYKDRKDYEKYWEDVAKTRRIIKGFMDIAIQKLTDYLKELQKQIRKEEREKIFSKIEKKSTVLKKGVEITAREEHRIIHEKIYQKIKEAMK